MAERMQAEVLNYRVIVGPDERTRAQEPCFTAVAPTLGVASDGPTVDEAIANITDAISAYLEALQEKGVEIPVDYPERDVIATVQVRMRPAVAI